MAQEVEIDLYEMAGKQIKEMSREIAESVDIAYDDFFADMYEHILLELDSEDAGGLPPMLKGYTNVWPNISARWAETKDKMDVAGGYNRFYRGVTRSAVSAKNLSNGKGIPGVKRASNKKASSKKAMVGPFADYIKSLNASGTTDRFFGPVSLKYELFGINEKISVSMGTKGNPQNGPYGPNEIRHLAKSIVTKKGGKGWSSALPNMVGTVNVHAFRSLQNINARDEWSIVDYILKRVDPANEKQWVKINSRTGWFGRGNRPIRAMVAPLVQNYINVKLPRAIHTTMDWFK